jgi:TetR/AcrR family transcriptional regulator
VAPRPSHLPSRTRKRRARRPGRPDADSGHPEVREALLQAAGRLFAAHGYRAVSLREIAQDAGVTPAMIHYYFGDKQGLYDAMLEEVFARVLQRVRGALSGKTGLGDGLPDLLEVLTSTFAAEPWLPGLMIREVFSEEGRFRERFIDAYASQMAALLPALVQREIAAGRFRDDLDPRLAFVSLLGMTVFPFVARPVVERVLGLKYDERSRRVFAEHTRRIFMEGVES